MPKLQKSTTDKVITGVCGGLADWSGYDATAIRLIFVLLTLLTGIFPMVIFYVIAALLMSESPKVEIVSPKE